ncbi:MAG: hypothetical protein EHM23_13500 [Acidobacteria bacterium]|nr:MAG: hypothetical protein EHM23_13500 [Acidobacteriota bacterium]
MDLNYYVMVLNKVNNDWRINWFVSTNPPEYVDTVISDQQRDTTTGGRQAQHPNAFSALGRVVALPAAHSGPESVSGFQGHIRIN